MMYRVCTYSLLQYMRVYVFADSVCFSLDSFFLWWLPADMDKIYRCHFVLFHWMCAVAYLYYIIFICVHLSPSARFFFFLPLASQWLRWKKKKKLRKKRHGWTTHWQAQSFRSSVSSSAANCIVYHHSLTTTTTYYVLLLLLPYSVYSVSVKENKRQKYAILPLTRTRNNSEQRIFTFATHNTQAQGTCPKRV